jgi:hypothetical protein
MGERHSHSVRFVFASVAHSAYQVWPQARLNPDLGKPCTNRSRRSALLKLANQICAVRLGNQYDGIISSDTSRTPVTLSARARRALCSSGELTSPQRCTTPLVTTTFRSPKSVHDCSASRSRIASLIPRVSIGSISGNSFRDVLGYQLVHPVAVRPWDVAELVVECL